MNQNDKNEPKVKTFNLEEEIRAIEKGLNLQNLGQIDPDKIRNLMKHFVHTPERELYE